MRTERAYSRVPSRSLPFRPRRGRAFTSHSSRNHTGSRRRGLGKTLLVSCLLIVVSLSARGQVSTATSSLQPHAPIVINGNSNFNSGNGVTSGSGTASDPYVIEGWNITSNGTTGISISNTDAYFVIRSVYVIDSRPCCGGAASDPGVNMTNVTNGVLRDSIIRFGYFTTGVAAAYVKNFVVENVTTAEIISITNSTGVVTSYDTARHIEVGSSFDVQISNNFAGIYVSSSSNVTISDNTSDGAPNKTIGVSYSSNITISGNSYDCDCLPVSVQNSNHVIVIGNSLNGNEWIAIVSIVNSDFIDVSDNTVSGDSYGGIVLSTCHDVSIKNNHVSTYGNNLVPLPGGEVGISGCKIVNISNNTLAPTYYRYPYTPPLLKVSFSSDLTVSGNNLSNAITAVSILNSSNATITGNTLQSNAQGLILNNTANIQVFHNNFLNNALQAQDTNSTQNIWDNGYPSGGNVWSDYTGVDNCSGPQQNICPSPDGIGDTPYTFNNNQDNYPLMQPFVPDPPAAVTVAPEATPGGGGGGGLRPLHV